MKLLVVGGNGFVGSAVAKRAVARGWNVVSISRSGKSFKSPQGHKPSWTDKVDWRRGSPFDAASYATLLPTCDAVVSTLGVLFEDDYKSGGRASPVGVLRGVLASLAGDRGNPLAENRRDGTYEKMNRDAALAICDGFAASASATSPRDGPPAPFVYLSAEDIFRPFVPERYIKTKRQAEIMIADRVRASAAMAEAAGRRIRPVFIRPSLIYHPHLNPATTLPATLLEATAKLHALTTRRPHPTSQPDVLSQTLDIPPAYASFAALMRIPPIHVDAVGEAVCRSIEDPSINGVVDVPSMRRMLDFEEL